MADYQGNTCPVCKEKFKSNDDIVVCPDCGTPYHRVCWQKVGVCVHQAEHAAGFEWTPDKAPEAALDDVVCPNCGAHNPTGAKFCNHCGVSLPDHPDNTAHRAEQERQTGPIYQNGPRGDAPYGGTARPQHRADDGIHMEGFRTGADGAIYRKEIGPDDAIAGIKARDWASYVGRSSMYYLMQFFRMDETKHKITVCLSAFFFGPAYFFYRKMWKEGGIFFLISLLLSMPTLLIFLVITESKLVSGMPTGWLNTASSVCYVLNWAQMVIRSLFAVHWYKQDGARKIQRIYAQVPEGPRRSDALAMSGGTSVLGVVAYFVVYFVVYAAFALMMGPNVQALFSFLMM